MCAQNGRIIRVKMVLSRKMRGFNCAIIHTTRGGVVQMRMKCNAMQEIKLGNSMGRQSQGESV